MKKLPAAKRNQLILVIIGTVGLIVLVYFILIQPQNEQNQKLAVKINSEAVQLDQMKTEIRQKGEITATLTNLEGQLKSAEEDVVSGDVYAWTFDTLRRFKGSYHDVDVPSLSQPTYGEVDLIPGFPYRQVKFSINGSGLYQDLGKFIADFENKFPHIRLNNLALDPAGPSAAGGSTERLNFRLDIIALTRPTP
jgi:Tfp pilus assembly protein PilO